jgi:hypothetical protein
METEAQRKFIKEALETMEVSLIKGLKDSVAGLYLVASLTKIESKLVTEEVLKFSETLPSLLEKFQKEIQFHPLTSSEERH